MQQHFEYFLSDIVPVAFRYSSSDIHIKSSYHLLSRQFVCSFDLENSQYMLALYVLIYTKMEVDTAGSMKETSGCSKSVLNSHNRVAMGILPFLSGNFEKNIFDEH